MRLLCALFLELPLVSLVTSPHELSVRLKELGARLGFSLVGIAPAGAPTGLPRFQQWLEQGFAGEMQYLPRRAAAYEHPRSVLPTVRSLVMVAVNYRTAPAAPISPAVDGNAVPARIATYAQGRVDYHDLIRERLQEMAAELHRWQPECRTRCVVDTAPLLERDFARVAGLGWFGKNTMLINKHWGSFQFLGALLTSAELQPDEPHATAHCGTCTRCLEACPTAAFPEPGVLDARRCIAYLTIELKGSIPEELRAGMQDWLFGCDVCQDVCPWNRKAPLGREPQFQPQPLLQAVDALEILRSTDEQLQTWLQGLPQERTGPIRLKRNAAIVAGNSGQLSAVPVLEGALQHPSPIVQEAVRWALQRLRGNEGDLKN